MKGTRDLRVDNVRGVLIFLVVAGHFLLPVNGERLTMNLMYLIYSFHMPCFMLVSGYLSHGIYTREGSVLGVKSIAVSAVAKRGGYDLAIEFVKNNLPKLVESIPPFVTLNVNVPCGFREEIKGVRAVPLGLRRYNDWYERDGKGGYELFGAPLDCSDCEKDTDCKMSDLSYITLTPVPVFTTDEEALKAYAAKEWKL